jgi:phosphohistidine phosphatase
MMRLILMRHAKSDWDDPRQPDRDRPLNARGRRNAAALGDWLRAAGLEPERALISGAVRTRETWELLGLAGEALFEDALYHAGPDTILRVLRAKGGTAQPVLVLAHNPGIGALAETLAPEAGDSDLARYPTGATAVFEATGADWEAARGFRLVSFVTPRRLAE